MLAESSRFLYFCILIKNGHIDYLRMEWGARSGEQGPILTFLLRVFASSWFKKLFRTFLRALRGKFFPMGENKHLKTATQLYSHA